MKANKVADVLNRKSSRTVANMINREWNSLKENSNSESKLDVNELTSMMAVLRREPEIM